MSKKGYFTRIMAGMLIMILLAGCSKGEKIPLNPKSPTVVTLWHSYNAFAKDVFDDYVMEFNDTIGIEIGIVVDTYGYGSSKELDTALYNSANHIIGAEPLPNMAVIYPDSAYRLDQQTPLVSLDTYFLKEELERYQQEFLAEGLWDGSSSPKMIPIAKSTELLYLNQTDWEKFSDMTGIPIESLATWEGLTETAQAYYDWSGGQAFLGFNGFNDFAFLSAAQLNVHPFEEKDGTIQFNFPLEVARRVWDSYYVPHINGWYQSNTYNQDGIKSGKLISFIGSSAGAGYFPKEIIVNEHESYPIDCMVLAYPTFEGGIPYMSQRGANMCVFSSDKAHEYAAAEFIKWFTKPEQNMVFSVSTGYIPVEKDSLSSIPALLNYVGENNNIDAVKKSVTASLEQMNQGKFYAKAAYRGSYESNTVFSESLAKKTALDLEAINIRTGNGEDKESVIEELLDDQNFQKWYLELCSGNGWKSE